MRIKELRTCMIVLTLCCVVSLCKSLKVSAVEVELNIQENEYNNEQNTESSSIDNDIDSDTDDEIVNIKMVGDCLIHSPVYKAAYDSSTGSYNFNNIFENIKDDIESADIAIINQETIFINDSNKYSGYPTFGSPTAVGDAEVNAGFDVIAHATNHTMDKGVQGINDTLAFWGNNYPDIKVLGIHESANDSDIEYMECKGINIAFVNYTYGLNGLESRRKGKEYIVDMIQDIDVENTLQEAENNADITIAILHIGTEYVYKPTAYQTEQVDRFIDNGADIVICAHPHVVEPYEVRRTSNNNEALVFWSLGNFISNQNEIPRILGGMADITIQKNDNKVDIINYTMTPIVTHQEKGYYTVYKIEDYKDDICSRHKLQYKKKFNIDYLNELYNSIVY